MDNSRALVALVTTLCLALAGPGRAAGKLSFADLLANLKSPTAKTRQEAAAALGKSRRREAVAPLSALVRDPEPKVRMEVVLALRELRDLSAVPALVTSLGDGDPKIREEYYKELEKNGVSLRLEPVDQGGA
jgi:HEAT repeat protein